MERVKKTFVLLSIALSLALSVCHAEGPSRRERLHWAAEAQTRMAQKDYAAAAGWLEKAVAPGAADRDLAEWWPALGRCYEQLGNFQKSLAAYQKARRLRPKSLDRVLDLARVYAAAELDDEAIGLYEEALRRDRQRRDVMLALADLYVRRELWEKARALCGRYLELEPRDAAAQRLMARAEEALGDLASAARRMEGVLAVRPSGPDYFYAGRLWARQDQFELAERAFTAAAAQGLASPAFLVERGLLAWRQGASAAAARHWKAALDAAPGMPEARFLLALDGGKGSAEMRRLASDGDAGYVKELAGAFLAAQGER
jgi:tetratricopeptide (TPR) repeat protein